MFTEKSYDSELIRVRTPDGTMYVLFMKNKDNTIAGFKITIGKAGAPVAAWASALAEMMNLVLEKGGTIEDILTVLSGITSDRNVRSVNSVCRSGPEGVWQAIVRFRQGGPVVDHHDLDERSVRGASVAPWARQRRNA